MSDCDDDDADDDDADDNDDDDDDEDDDDDDDDDGADDDDDADDDADDDTSLHILFLPLWPWPVIFLLSSWSSKKSACSWGPELSSKTRFKGDGGSNWQNMI